MSLIQESPERIYEALKEKLPLKARLIAKAVPLPNTEEEGIHLFTETNTTPAG